MSHDHALVIVNSIHDQLSGLARAIVQALDDGRISPWEGLALGMRGTQLASTVMVALQGTDAVTRREILEVLERGDWVMTDGN